MKISTYPTGIATITAACTGPDEGLTGIKRSKLHLSASYADDIDFIDTIQDECLEVRKSSAATTSSTTTATNNRKLSNRSGSNGYQRKANNSATTPTSDQNANKTIGGGGMRSRKNSRTSISNLAQSRERENSNKSQVTKEENKANKSTTIVVSMISTKSSPAAIQNKMKKTEVEDNDQNNKNLLNTKTEHATATTMKTLQNESNSSNSIVNDNTERLLREAVSNVDGRVEAIDDNDATVAGVTNWKMETEYAYGISVSLYENNLLTKESMGNPIADCYGLVVRGDAAAMAVADGVNWGNFLIVFY